MSVFKYVSSIEQGRLEVAGMMAQRILSAVILIAIIIAAKQGHITGPAALVSTGWFILALIFPKVFGVISGAFIFCGSALILFMGENGSSTTFRPEAIPVLVPFWIFAAFYKSRAFAGSIAYAIKGVFISLIIWTRGGAV